MTQETEDEHVDPLEAIDDDELDLEEIDLQEFGDVEQADTEGPPPGE